MSLDVYLYTPQPGPAGSGIFIRENGEVRELTRAEWDEKFPDREPVTFEPSSHEPVYSANITHNLGRMADQADIYMALWRPDEIGIKTAAQLIDPLRAGLERLQADPDHFKSFNPENGWGDYDGLVSWVARYLHACEEYPDAEISVSR